MNCVVNLIIAVLCVLVSPTTALAIGKGLVRIDDENFDIFNNNIPLNQTDTRLSIGFTLVEETDNEKFVQPEQVMISLSAPNIVSEFYLHPNFIQNKVFEANIAMSDISKFLLSEEEIFVTVITGDPENESYNKILMVGTLKPSEKLRASKHVELPKRLTQNNEIHHNFKDPPKNLPSFISNFFATILLTIFVSLLVAWNYVDAINFNNLNKFGPSTFIFLASIIALEYTFFDYYIGTSIFTTLYRFAIIAIISVFFGSKTLTNLYKLRQENLR
ncbi:hypothetical protein CANINC_001147 [Pichia inconspicua]|uniref:Ribophorin II C-terminal domain-containing protein n=1 Tax=Pichia inconspicua TaxID=52247 RepID=A0A4T0X5J3_9ASCO|nr:hypothetical protein CANINC_001147 [[Candida] inconspicua]